MARLAARLALALVALGAACRPPSTDRNPLVTVNGCEPGLPCAGGRGACARDGDDGPFLCFARRVDLTEIVVEIQPSATSPLAPPGPRYARFDVDPGDVLRPLGSLGVQVPNVNVVARRPDAIAGELAWRSTTGCDRPTAVNRSVGVRATFRPLARLAGLDATVPRAEARPVAVDVGGQPLAWSLALPLSPGDYDVYLEPIDEACPTPPLLVRGYGHCTGLAGREACLLAGGATLAKSYRVRRLQGAFLLPRGASLEGWRVEVVEGQTGLRLSTPGVVRAADACGAAAGPGVPENVCRARYGAPGPLGPGGVPPDLEYGEVQAGATDSPVAPADASLYVRLFPPPDGGSGPLCPPGGRHGPVFAWLPVSVGAGEGPDVAVFDLDRLPTECVALEGRIENAGLAAPGAVWFRSRALLDQPVGVTPLVQGVVPTDPDGVFSLSIPPGAYDVVGVPNDRALGRVQLDWDIPRRPSAQGGRVLSANNPAARSVRVLDPAGREPLSGTFVSVEPRPTARLPIDVVRGLNPFDPRTSTGVTDRPDGSALLVLDADRAGGYVLTVPFDRRTGLPWTVLPAWPDPSGVETDIVPTLPWEIFGKVVVASTLADLSQGGANGPQPLRGGSVRVYGRRCGGEGPGCDETPFLPIGAGVVDPGDPDPAAEAENPRAGTFAIFLPSSL